MLTVKNNLLKVNDTSWGKGAEGAELVEGNSAAAQLSSIADFAYGTKNESENTSGGFGRIGLIDKKIVKFATSHTDRLFVKTTQDMKDSCNNLRKKLYKLSIQYLGKDVGLKDEQLNEKLKGIRAKLGLDDNIDVKKGTGLLDRKVVASVIKDLDDACTDALNKIKGQKSVGMENGTSLYLEICEQKRGGEEAQQRLNDAEETDGPQDCRESNVNAARDHLNNMKTTLKDLESAQSKGNSALDELEKKVIPRIVKPFVGVKVSNKPLVEVPEQPKAAAPKVAPRPKPPFDPNTFKLEIDDKGKISEDTYDLLKGLTDVSKITLKKDQLRKLFKRLCECFETGVVMKGDKHRAENAKIYNIFRQSVLKLCHEHSNVKATYLRPARDLVKEFKDAESKRWTPEKNYEGALAKMSGWFKGTPWWEEGERYGGE